MPKKGNEKPCDVVDAAGILLVQQDPNPEDRGVASVVEPWA